MAECLGGRAWSEFFPRVKPFAAADGSFPAESTRQATDAWRDDEIPTETLRAVIELWRNECTLADAVDEGELSVLSNIPGQVTATVRPRLPGGATATVTVEFTIDGGETETITEEVSGERSMTVSWEAEPGEYEVCADVTAVRP